MPRIVMTGGGTAGHVTPNIALFPCLKEKGFEISYIGSRNAEKKPCRTGRHNLLRDIREVQAVF